MNKLKIKCIDKDLPLPKYQSEGASGMDLYVAEDTYVAHDCTVLVPTGVAVEIPEGMEGQVRPRSSMVKDGLMVANSPGTIDADYRGEIGVLIRNQRKDAHTIQLFRGQRVAQLVICPIIKCTLEEVDELSETVRGSGGFGSTGEGTV